MKIGVAGTFIRDRIFPWQGTETESIGGLYFTVAYMARLANPGTEIIPICFIGKDFAAKVTQQLEVYDNIKLDGMILSEQPNTCVTLTYPEQELREEKTTPPMPPLEYAQLEFLKDADALVVNLITGFDVSLHAMQNFRTASNGIIYLDFHSRTLGIDKSGKRYYKYPEDWQSWAKSVDILQLNEMEARTLAGVSGEVPVAQLLEFGMEILRLGPKVCHITLAEKGSCLCYREGQYSFSEILASAGETQVVDAIGCGDAFQAAFMIKFLDGSDLREATMFAHQVAAANCTFVGSSGIDHVKKYLEDK